MTRTGRSNVFDVIIVKRVFTVIEMIREQAVSPVLVKNLHLLAACVANCCRADNQPVSDVSIIVTQ